MGIAAVVLALALTAFTTKSSSKPAPQTLYKWYTVSYAPPYQATGAILQATDLPFGNTLKSADYAVSNDGCPDSGPKHCVRGFLSGMEPVFFPYEPVGQTHTPRPN